MEWELITISGEDIEPAKLVWRRYKRRTKGITEIFLDANPEMVKAMGTSPYIPVGLTVMMPIDQRQIEGQPESRPQVRMTGTM